MEGHGRLLERALHLGEEGPSALVGDEVGEERAEARSEHRAHLVDALTRRAQQRRLDVLEVGEHRQQVCRRKAPQLRAHLGADRRRAPRAWVGGFEALALEAALQARHFAEEVARRLRRVPVNERGGDGAERWPVAGRSREGLGSGALFLRLMALSSPPRTG